MVMMMRLLYRSNYRRSLTSFARAPAAAATAAAAAATTTTTTHHHLSRGRRFHISFPSFSTSPKRPSPDSWPFWTNVGSTRSFSDDVSHMPVIRDAEINIVFKDLMAATWDEIPDTVIHDAKKALSKNTEDKAGQEVLANVFCAAEAVEEFTGKLVSLRMEIDDSIGLSGENVKRMPDVFVNALRTAFQRYTAYLDAFGSDETFLRKKVENEVGTRMIHLKMRCGGIGSEWGKVTVLGTSGLSGSNVEQRA